MTTRRIVIVIGPGRSGTSTVAGALAKSGLEVPGKAIPGNETNPSGFYEPRWVVDFHRSLLERATVGTLDPSPDVLERMANATAKPQVRERLRTWLGDRLEEQPLLVVKDPRTIWFRDLWVDTARELGVEPGFVTMLRHPAEVSASRQKYYTSAKDVVSRADDVHRIAGWVNVALTAERVTQGSPRNFVRYTDLVADWRSVLTRIGQTHDLHYTPDLDVAPHPVDEFIDPSLHRVQVDWSDVQIPAHLRDLGERSWNALTRLADEGEAADAVAEAETLRAEYAQLVEDAVAVSRGAIRRAEAAARRKARRQLRDELAAEAPEAGADEGAGKGTDKGRAQGGLWSRITGGRA
ncbi:MAG: sulfotransferase family protein [Nocardioidaceae bacterium]